MHNDEINSRAIGMLTTALTYEGDDAQLDQQLATLVEGVMDFRLSLPGDASPQEIGEAVRAEDARRWGALARTFFTAFLRLADEHDAGNPDKTALEVLRAMALEPPPDDDD